MPSPESELTSFGFWNEEGDEQQSLFDLGSIISRVRNAFAAPDSTTDDSAPSAANPSSLASASTTADVSSKTSAVGGSYRPAPSTGVGGSTSRKASVDHQRKLSKTFPASSANAKGINLNANSSNEASAGTSQLSSIKDVQSVSKAKLPFALSSTRQAAPAVISTTAAHAVSRNRIQSVAISDDRSVAANDGEVEDGEDVLTALMRRSGVDHTRASAGRYTSIPGFPLSKDILADDNRSVHSSSSRMPRSEVNSTSEAQYIVAHSHIQERHHSRAGLGTSAEAFRRMRGEGAVLSKAFWMPDENVKECRECQSYFTPFRRKHHCRICGLVYCSRCASNVVSGSRFGLEGSEIRVCNFCLRMLSEYERAGLRSSSSAVSMNSSPKRVATTYARKRTESTGMASKPDKGMISGPLEAQLTHPQAQFAANQLFSYPRSGLSKGLPALSSRYDLMGDLDESSRPQTPIADMLGRIVDEHLDEPVPFRTKLSEEDGVIRDDDDDDHDDDRMDIEIVQKESEGDSPIKASAIGSVSTDRVPFPKTVDDDATSMQSSRMRDARTKRLGEAVVMGARQRLVSDAALRAYRKSRLRTKEGSSVDDEGKRSMRSLASSASFFPRSHTKRDSLSSTFLASPTSTTELSQTSTLHISTLLSQLLKSARIPSAEQWQMVLEPLIHSMIRHIHPNPKLGESMDIRQYIKMKRIPGGSVSDSCYVDGFVLSKQVATKKMARSLPMANPRVMVVTFPIDFHRAEGHFMSLEPLLAQEHEYTRILVARILQLRPNVLVVKDTVSRLALDMLEDAGVLVVWSIKMSAVQAISRCCQADIITSIDRLALEPRLGRCASFAVETYQHAQSPHCRKSIMRFLTTGNARSFGCTIILRGANLDRLGQIKKIVSMLAFVAHNLRLEEQLSQNEGAQTAPAAKSYHQLSTYAMARVEAECARDCVKSSDTLKDQIEQALVPFEHNVLSASATIAIPPPHALVKMKQSYDKVRALKKQCSCEEDSGQKKAESADGLPADIAEHGGDDDMTPRAEMPAMTLPTLEEAMPKPSELQASCARAQLEHDLSIQDWKTCTDIDPTASIQKLSVLCTLMSSATQKPCMGPVMMSWHFYSQGDESLGHFLERTCAESGTICSAKGCGRPRGVHYSSFVHNETRVQVVQERFVCPIPGQENRLLMWSYCKKCEQATPVTPVSDDSWGFSFAKYLELHFYNVNKTTSLCGHDYYADFIRFFSLQNLAIRFHRDRDLTVREVILPPLRLLPRPDVDYRLKVEGAKALQARMDVYWASVLDRMAALRKEPHMSVQHSTQLDLTMQRVKGDESDLRAFLISTCQTSKQTDILALNVVRNRLQAAVVRWDQFFQEFERNALPNERDMRRLTTHHLSRLFQEKSDGSQGVERVADALGLTPAAEVDEGALSGVDLALSTSTSGRTSPHLPTQASLTSICDSSPPLPGAETEETELSSATSPVLSSLPAAWRQKRSQTLQESNGPGMSIDSSLCPIEPRTDNTDSESLSTAHIRPTLRRGKTAEGTPHRRKVDQSGKHHAGKIDKIAPLKGGLQQPSSGPAGPGGRRNTAVQRRGPPSSYKPPKGAQTASSSVENDSDGGATSSSSAIQHSIRRKTGLKRGRAAGLEEGIASTRLQSSRVPVPTRTSSKVSTIARRFDNLAKEAEKERERQKHVMAVRARRARPVAASKATVQVYRSVKEAVRDDDESESDISDNEGEAEDEDEDEGVAGKAKSSSNRLTARRTAMTTSAADDGSSSSGKVQGDGQESKEAAMRPVADGSCESTGSSPERERGPLAVVNALVSPLTSINMDGTHESAAAELTVSSLLSGTLPASWRGSLLPEGDTGDTRGSLLKTIASLWGRGNAHLPLIELPMSSTEHLFTDSPLVVLREDEPSSLIAFTLHSSTYASRLHSLREAQTKAAASSSEAGGLQEKKTDAALDQRARLESDLRQQEGTHLSFQFSSGDCRFSIRVLFTEQFDALRQACQCGQTFIQSLARCNNWVECSGGKSGVTMMKTLDDRFIIKQLSRAEMDAFASNAGAYFRFLADVLVQDRPTTLAKIYGVYRLTVRNAHTGKQIKLDCAITENVFANAGKMAQIYDLKGALRNRFVQPNGQATQVLQDGNLVTSKVPIFLRESAKRRLREALFHGESSFTCLLYYCPADQFKDSLFLANCEVMDYSLVVGVVEGEAEIRCGIIDVFGTFTRGKKLESFIKTRVVDVGGNMEAPTIIDPKQYRARFLSFLDSIMLLSPDHWLSKEEESRSAAVATLSSSHHVL